MNNLKVIQELDLTKHQKIENLMFAVQNGYISCGKAAEVIMEAHTGGTCEGCGNPATCSDADGIPLCDDCAKSLQEEL